MWVDCILVVGMIFCYDENGLVGLCGGKKLVIVLLCGGVYSVGLLFVLFDY